MVHNKSKLGDSTQSTNLMKYNKHVLITIFVFLVVLSVYITLNPRIVSVDNPFPPHFPAYPDATFIRAIHSPGSLTQAAFISSDTPEEVFDWYKSIVVSDSGTFSTSPFPPFGSIGQVMFFESGSYSGIVVYNKFNWMIYRAPFDKYTYSLSKIPDENE